MSNYFIMVNNPKEGIAPIIDDEEDVMLFETREEAEELMHDHMLAKAFGYEIFRRGGE